VVKASVGHVKDLPKKNMGIDIDNDFQPRYEVIDGRRRRCWPSQGGGQEGGQGLPAPDPDREGEAIAWHIADEIRPANSNIQPGAVQRDHQEGGQRRHRPPAGAGRQEVRVAAGAPDPRSLVGYEISPVLWTKVKRGLSAGRVQSVAVRLVAEREAEIKAFVPGRVLDHRRQRRGERAAALHRQGGAARRREAGDGPRGAGPHHRGPGPRGRPSRSTPIERKERKKNAPAPFITSKLQQEASSKLRFSPKRTMGLAQRLYEGMELGEEGPVGLITYMRTDSTRLSDDSIADVRGYITQRYGANFLPAEPNVFKTKKSAQDAHEAIRPTSVKYDPETVRNLLKNGGGGRDPRETEDLLKLYTLIWNRFVACQMNPAIFDQTSIEIEAGGWGCGPAAR
jgi:DNA topoisomerase-1